MDAGQAETMDVCDAEHSCSAAPAFISRLSLNSLEPFALSLCVTFSYQIQGRFSVFICSF